MDFFFVMCVWWTEGVRWERGVGGMPVSFFLMMWIIGSIFICLAISNGSNNIISISVSVSECEHMHILSYQHIPLFQLTKSLIDLKRTDKVGKISTILTMSNKSCYILLAFLYIKRLWEQVLHYQERFYSLGKETICVNFVHTI